MDKIDRSTYIANIGAAFDNGVSDANETKSKQPYEGAYAAGFDGALIAQMLRPIVVSTASRGWDDGTSGATRDDTPSVQPSLGNPIVLTDLKATYNQAYDLSRSYATQKTSGWTYVFGAAAVAVLAWAGWVYALPAVGLREMHNPRKAKLLTTQNTGRVEKLVKEAFKAKFDEEPGFVFYEHGQWWAESRGLDDLSGLPYTYSVVDAIPGVGGLGLDFEGV